MAKEGRWVVRRYESGNVIERSRVYVYTSQPVRKRKVKGNTCAAKADANYRQAVKVFARILNANFGVVPSLFIKLGYDDIHAAPEGEEDRDALAQTKKDAGNFLRRLKRKLKKYGVENVKTVTVCSDLDGETGELVREHVHLIVTAAGISFRDGAWYAGDQRIEDIWGNGSVWAENVAQGGDLTPLAVYLLRQARRQPDKKKYTCSRNMTPTTVTEEEVRPSREMKAPAGCAVRDTTYDQETGMLVYIRYIKPRKEKKTAPASAGALPPCLSGGGE